MPNEFSNFSLPDTGSTSAGYQAPPDPNNVGSNGYVWDPGTKQWVKGGSGQTAGNAATTVAPYMNPGYHSEEEKNRYRKMAANPVYTSGPAIARGASDETRGLSMDALGQLRARAQGAMTPAQALARQQTQGAVNGITSGAASIKGGAGARAAASRGAVATGARIGALGAQDEQALKAREMADASSQYFGASSAQRDRDIGAATEQAKLDAAQKAANEQRERNYEGLGYGTQVENVNNLRGATAEQATASNASRKAGIDEDNASFGRMKDVVSGVTGGIGGAASAYEQTKQPTTSSNPWDPSNYHGSDPRMKTGITPIGEGAMAGASLAGARNKDVKEYDGHYLGAKEAKLPKKGIAPSEDSAPSEKKKPKTYSLEELAGERNTEGDPYETHEKDPHDLPSESLFGGKMGVTAPKGYAAMRSGHEGAMFGASPRADYTDQLWGDEAGAHRKAPQWAPGSQDFYAGKAGAEALQRDITTSDPQAKRQAFIDGANHTQAMQDQGEVPPVPDYMAEGKRRVVEQHKAPKSTFVRQDKAGQRADVAEAERVGMGNDAATAMVANGFMSGSPVIATGTALGASAGLAYDTARSEQPLAPPPSQAEPPGYFGQAMARARTALSDPKTKTNVHDDPMADANRSMAPSSYEYKPEFTPPEQEQGEVNVGPMADKMKANPVAKTAIVTDPQSGLLAIDKTKGLKLVMGGLADLQRQVDRMREAR